MTLYNDFRNVLLNEKLYNDFKGSYFDHFRHIPEYYKFNGHMVYYILFLRVNNDKKLHEM